MKEKIKLTIPIIKMIDSNFQYFWYNVNTKNSARLSWSKKGMFCQITVKMNEHPYHETKIHNIISIILDQKHIEFYDINDKLMGDMDFNIDIEKIIKRDLILNSLLS